MSELTKKGKPLTVYLPDTRGVEISRFGRGNLKIGMNVFTYSRLPGDPNRLALGSGEYDGWRGTCPGATEECQRICYAARPVTENGAVAKMWWLNSITNSVPDLPEQCKLLRIHVSGDFDTLDYIASWYNRLKERPDVTAWAYTRSWRVPSLLTALEALRTLPSLQLFASMDKSHTDMPPVGWRRAWIDGDPRAGVVYRIPAHSAGALEIPSFYLDRTADERKALVCPEETKHVRDCEECGFCFKGQRNDVVFLEH